MTNNIGHAVHARTRDQDRNARLHDKLSRELGPEVCACLSDASVIEILLNADGTLWVERGGRPPSRLGSLAPISRGGLRLTTTAGERLIGRLIRHDDLAELRNAFGLDARDGALSPEAAIDLLLSEARPIRLRDGLTLRKAKVMGRDRVELTGFRESSVPALKALGLVSEIIAWRLRLFVPLGEGCAAIFSRLFETSAQRPLAAAGSNDHGEHRRRSGAAAGCVRRSRVPSLFAEWRKTRELLDCGRRVRRQRPKSVCPPILIRCGSGPLDRCRIGTILRPARPHPSQSRPCHCQRSF